MISAVCIRARGPGRARRFTTALPMSLLLLGSIVRLANADELRFESPAPPLPPAPQDIRLSIGSGHDVAVRWTDDAGAPVRDEPVLLTTTRGYLIGALQVRTDVHGVVRFVLRSDAGGPARLTASAGVEPATGLPISRALDLLFGAPTTLKVTAANAFVAPGANVPITAYVRDADNNPVADREVVFALVDPASGSLDVSSDDTDENGLASSSFVAPPAGSGIAIITGEIADPHLVDDFRVSISDRGLRIAEPEPMARLPINRRHRLEAQVESDGVPAEGRLIAFATTRGTVSSPAARSNRAGAAVVQLSSESAGLAILAAVDPTGARALVPVEFVGPEPVDRAAYVSSGRTIPIEIETRKIGVLIRDGVQREQLRPVAGHYGMAITSQYGQRIHALELPRRTDPDLLKNRRNLQAIARQIENGYPRLVKRAGLVAYAADAATAMIVPSEIIVQSANAAAIEAFLDSEIGVEDSHANPLIPGQLWIRLSVAPDDDLFTVLARLHDDVVLGREFEFAHPNFAQVLVERFPNDPLYQRVLEPIEPGMWHHRNYGQRGGSVDADIDTHEAWNSSIAPRGSGIVVAVLDSGFDPTHPDLQPNLWSGPPPTQMPGAGSTSGFCETASVPTPGPAVIGWDFEENATIDVTRGNPYHGTKVAGAVGARGNNAVGVIGSCPECELMLIRKGSLECEIASALAYARRHAHVITNSWGLGYNTPVNDAIRRQIDAAAASATVFWAMSNDEWNNCEEVVAQNDAAGESELRRSPDISAHDQVVAVAGVGNRDRGLRGGYGNCMDVLGPTRGGTLGIVTTVPVPSPNPFQAGDPLAGQVGYTLGFGGTSAATPIVAGVAGLVLEAGDELDLKPATVRRILQDTADKVQPSVASYDRETGTNPAADSTHGYGRVNAFEAVRLVMRRDKGGGGGVDVMIRDHHFDWGNTEQPSSRSFEPYRDLIPYWGGTDIKIDAAPLSEPITTSADFAAFQREDPIVGQPNRVYVRIRNRGPQPASQVRVTALWAFEGTRVPDLPTTFWNARPAAQAGAWQVLGTGSLGTLAYTGPSAQSDRAAILSFDLSVAQAVQGQTWPWQHAVLAIAESCEDPVWPIAAGECSGVTVGTPPNLQGLADGNGFAIDYLVTRYNNVAMRTVRLR